MRKTLPVLMMLALALPLFAGGESEAAGGKGPLVWVWYPNESLPELAQTRGELVRIVSETLGREITEQLTTDYAIAIEALVNDNAAFSWFGGEGYTQAHARNEAVLPLVTNSPGDTLANAKYYSMIAVLKENGPQYITNGQYDLSRIRGRSFSFVSNSSTSGFRVPSTVISQEFGVLPEDLLEGGRDKVFSEVMFGQSHQGSMFNVMTGRAEVGVFCNECVFNWTDWSDANYDDPKPGDVIRVKPNQEAPFDQIPGIEVVFIATVPVLNAPLVMNTNLLTDEEVQALIDVLTSDAVANNKLIFGARDGEVKTLWREGSRFLPVEDEWYDPIRRLSGLL